MEGKEPEIFAMPRHQYILPLLLLTACSRQSNDQEHSFRIYEQDGIRIAETRGGPKYQGEIFSYELILTLQGNESNFKSLLHLPRSSSPPTSFTIDTLGYFYIADTRNHRIAVFRPDGTFERSIGQYGEGPGDLRYPRLIAENDGILHIQDGNRRTTLYATDGALVDVIQHSRGGNSIWGQGEYVVDIRSPSNPPEWTTMRSEALIRNTRGDTITFISTPELMIAFPVPTIALIDNSRRMRPVGLQYSAWPQIIQLQNFEFLLYAGTHPELLRYDSSGKLIQRVWVDIPSEPITTDDRRIIEDRLRELMQLALTRPSELPFRMNPSDIPFPDVKAPWQAIEVDDSGYIWLQESLPSFPFSPIGIEPIEYLLLSPEGEYLGNTHRPIAANGQVARGYFLALVNDEDMGIAVPTVYRIHSNIREFDYP